MKKKLIALTLIVCLIAVVGLTGCGSKPYSQYDHNGFEDNADAHL